MATVTPKCLVEGTDLADTLGTLYTVPLNTTAVLRAITLTNHDSATRTFTLHLVPSGGSPSQANRIFDAIEILGNKVVENDTLKVLHAGGSIQAMADVASKVSIRVDGSEVA